jgi:hypothetical protein
MRALTCFRRLLGRLALAVSLGVPAAAWALPVVGPFTPGFIGEIDNRAAVLVGAHPGETEPFADAFVFTVGSTAGLFGATFDLQEIDGTIAAEDIATIFSIALYDGAGALLASDADGSDGFSFSVLLPSAGAYGMLVVGIGGSGAGLYAGLLVSEGVAIATPGSVSLAALSLVLMTRLRRRQSHPAAR